MTPCFNVGRFFGRRGVAIMGLVSVVGNSFVSASAWTVGLNSAGVGVGVWKGRGGLEARAQWAGDTTAYLARVVRIAPLAERWAWYGGLEGGMFFSDSSSGDTTQGPLGGGFLGLRCEVTRRFFLDVDMGPYVAWGKSGEFSSSVVDVAVNASFNFRFAGVQR